MNRRVRCICRSSPKREEGVFRYLRPGALAQLRDSRISARSQRPNSKTQISLYRVASSISPTTGTNIQTQISVMDGFPCFAGRIYGPRFPQRKKLVASKSIFFMSSTPSSPVSDSSDSLIDGLNVDLLVAH